MDFVPLLENETTLPHKGVYLYKHMCDWPSPKYKAQFVELKGFNQQHVIIDQVLDM